ncbi:MAG: type I 3-dehydroquinate dehydratase [Lachnospiraceae bacterium]|nr:type I 3-dehydroquinate dehydratase [Lachnospiraceae bacterium]
MQTTAITIRGVEFGVGMPKICIPIVARTKEELLNQARDICRKDPDCVELRIDWYEDVNRQEQVLDLLRQLRALLGNRVLLCTFRTDREGGKSAISCDSYKALYRMVCQSGYVDLIDVEAYMEEGLLEDVVRMAHKADVRVVASNHDFQATPPEEELIKRLQFMDLAGADFPKLAVTPNREEDVLTLMSATLQYRRLGGEKPVITMSMGRTGTISRLAGEVFGSAVTFATAGQASAPGQIPVDEVRQALRIFHAYR